MMCYNIRMVSIHISIVDRAFNIQEGSITLLRWLIIGLVIAGIVFGVMGCYWTKLVWLVEALIVPTLIRSIKSYRSVSKDSIGLLNEATRTLNGARKQAEIEERIKREQIK